MVNDTVVRFDFTHFSALTTEEAERVENIVNSNIFDAITVENREMPIEEAKKLGAMALFGEKYGDTVRVVKAADKSVEFCGGTHVNNTGKIGMFKIISESSVAAGVRRIEAVTGFNVLKLISDKQALINETAATLKVGNPQEIASRAAAVMAELKTTEKTVERLEAKLAAGKLTDIMSGAQKVGDITVIGAVVENSSADEIRSMCEKIKAESDTFVAVLAAVNAEKITFCAASGKETKIHAGNLVREVAKIAGGNGGGKPELAMAGGKDVTKVNDAIAAVVGLVKESVGK